MKARIPKHREFIIDFPKEVSQEKADEGWEKLTALAKCEDRIFVIEFMAGNRILLYGFYTIQP